MGVKILGAAVAALLAVTPAAAVSSTAPGSPTATVASAGSGSPTATAARVAPAPAAALLTLVFPLRADLAGLRAHALAVSTPGSPQYGAYQSLGALARRYGASPATRRVVSAYLRRAGARGVRVDPTGLFAEATFSAARAARLFSTPLTQFRAADGARFIAPARSLAVAAAAPRLPAGLRPYATGVVGLDTRALGGAPTVNRLSRARAHVAAQKTSAMNLSGSQAGCAASRAADGFTPNQYLTAYGYDPLHAAGLKGQGERVAVVEIDGFKYGDIKAFARCFGLGIPALNGFGVGLAKPLAPGGEATLDLEVLIAAAPRLKSIDVYETHPTAAATLRALTAPLGNSQKPQVISASLGLCEPALVQAVHTAGIEAAEGALQMASAAGITVLASSGDSGSADCTDDTGFPLPMLAVNYPASSWWVTGVGGTNVALNAANMITSQVVWDDAAVQPGSAGGGGVSDVFARPNYQNGATRADGRAVPDVSMLADIIPGYAIFCSARPSCVNATTPDPWQSVGGTSAATPLLAGGFALLDQALHGAHRQDLGLVNPLLYRIARKTPSVFDDVTAIGNDVGPETSNGRPLGCCTAKRGYDTASGLGSLNLAAFKPIAMAAEPATASVGLSLPRGQSPVRSHEIRATVSCSRACVFAAYADVTIRHHGSFEVDSSIFRMSRRGSRTITLRFGTGELRQLRAALRARNRITATVHGVMLNVTVYGVLPSASRSIAKRSPARSLTVRG